MERSQADEQDGHPLSRAAAPTESMSIKLLCALGSLLGLSLLLMQSLFLAMSVGHVWVLTLLPTCCLALTHKASFILSSSAAHTPEPLACWHPIQQPLAPWQP